MTPIIKSIIDLDVYKLSQGQFAQRYPEAQVRYRFTNRANTPFRHGFADELREQIRMMADLRLTNAEYDFLRATCPYLKPTYLDWLKGFRFNPDSVDVAQNEDGTLSLDIFGKWYREIYWETCLMSLISELHFSPFKESKATDWEDRIIQKGEWMNASRVFWTDFGTRRRFSYDVQDRVVALHSKYKDFFVGSSNPHFCMKYGLIPKGTLAHESIMAMQAKVGVLMCNREMMDEWQDEFKGNLGMMLTDTVTTNAFLEDFNVQDAKLWDGLRHDSEDPILWANKVLAHYQKLGIDPKSKTLLFSDALTPQKWVDIVGHIGDQCKLSSGIGTDLTNDVGYKSLNMVIKPVAFNFGRRWIDVFKLSDSKTKHMGNPEVISFHKKHTLGIAA